MDRKSWFFGVLSVSILGIALIFLGVWHEGLIPLVGYIISAALFIPLSVLSGLVWKHRLLTGIGVVVVLIQLSFLLGVI